MNNFFYNSSEYSLFRKALRETNGEPVLINILSTDPSLNDDKQEVDQPQRKNQSSKYEPTASPFGRFFGERKTARTAPVDMKDFSSWKNKNYRKVEQSINDEEKLETPKFSLSDYMNRTMSENKFNDSDQLTTETQKPINELSSDDPLYKRFSLDSYLHKLEEQNQSKNKFEENDDLLEPLGDVSQMVIPDSSQDEDFGLTSEVDVEGVAFDEDISGERFSFDQSELDKVKNRLEKMEREAANIKDKSTTKVISTNELSDIANEDDELDISKLLGEDISINEDDIDEVNKKLGVNEDDSSDTQESLQEETPKVEHKTFVQINRTPTGEGVNEANDVIEETNEVGFVEDSEKDEFDKFMDEINEELEQEEASENIDESVNILEEFDQIETDEATEPDEIDYNEETLEGDLSVEETTESNFEKTNFVTKEDLESLSEELLEKFTNMNQKDDDVNSDEMYQPYIDQTAGAVNGAQQYDIYGNPVDSNVQLQTKIFEMIEENKKADAEAREKLRLAEEEKNRIAEEYETRLKDLEQAFKQKDEENKQKAYLDKLKNDIKLKKAESNFKLREQRIKEFEKESSEKEKIGVMLRKELKNNLNIANLEMDKKLLEVASKIKREYEIEQEEELRKVRAKSVQTEEDENLVDEEVEEEEEEKPKTTKKTTSRSTKRKTTRRSHSHTRTARRKIDSDIIGGINFD